MTVDELRAETEHAETLARVLERQLATLSAGTDWKRTLGIELPIRSDYSADDLGRAQYAHALSTRRLAWLEGRWHELNGRTERRAERVRVASAGVSRFIDGDLTLADVTRPERERRRAERELARSGPPLGVRHVTHGNGDGAGAQD